MHVIDPFSREDLVNLRQFKGEHCVSLYLPTHRKGAEVAQDPIRLKNLLNDAEQELTARGARWDDIEAILGDTKALLDKDFFWQHLAEGLAIFARKGDTRVFRTGVTFAESFTVSDRFDLAQMVRLLSTDGRFYVLAIGEQMVKLLEGTRYSVSEISLDSVPQSIAEALRFDDPEKQLQFHTGAGAAPDRAGRSAIFHGHRFDGSENKENLKRFFNLVDKGLEPIFKSYPAPVVLAAVEYYHPFYKEVANVPGLIEGGITGNPDVESDEDLHARAWEVVYPVFKADQDEALASYAEFQAVGQTTDSIEDTVVAAIQGRIQTLFMDSEGEVWGTFDEATQTVDVHDVQNPQDIELLNESALQVITSGGRVFTMPSAEIPGGGPLASVLRYA